VTDRDWKVLTEQTLLDAPPFLHVSVQSIELPDGRQVEAYYQVRMPDVVTVFAETGDARIVVMRSYRHGVRRVCLGFPGGHVSPGEDPLLAIQREFLEETGYAAAAWEPLGSFVTNANHRCQTVHYFRATGCRVVATPDSGDLEDAEIVLLERAAVLDAWRRGEFPFLGQVALISLALNPDLFR
jgi:ADP-ribose pyrophosphatase